MQRTACLNLRQGASRVFSQDGVSTKKAKIVNNFSLFCQGASSSKDGPEQQNQTKKPQWTPEEEEKKNKEEQQEQGERNDRKNKDRTMENCKAEKTQTHAR